MRQAKKRECMAHMQEEKQAAGTDFGKVQMLNLADPDFEAAILNMFKQLKETTQRRKV